MGPLIFVQATTPSNDRTRAQRSDRLSAITSGRTSGHLIYSGRLKSEHRLTCENVEGNKMNLGVAVLAGLGGRHFHDLAGAVLNKYSSISAQIAAWAVKLGQTDIPTNRQ